MSNRLNYLYLMNKASEANDRQTYDFYMKQANQEKFKEISKRSLRCDYSLKQSTSRQHTQRPNER